MREVIKKQHSPGNKEIPVAGDQPQERNHESYREELLQQGLSATKAALFIISQVVGSGILALPNAISGTGWIGVLLLFVFGVLAMYCGIILGECWIIIRKKYNISAHSRDPYPVIGFYSIGKLGKYTAEVCIFLTLIGSAIVYLILASKQLSNILNISVGSFDTPKSEFRVWILIFGFLLIPCTWYASPKEMWFVAYAATFCSFVSCILIVIRSIVHLHHYGTASIFAYKSPTTKSFFSAFGTIAFNYGGGVLLPSLQTDMKHPSRFTYAAYLGYTGMFLLYLPSSILPYLTVGSNIDSSVLETLKELPDPGRIIVDVAEILMTIYMLAAVIILMNPTSQLLEEKLKFPHGFGWRRVVLRSLLGLLVIGIAELFPNFGPILSFIGASTVTLMSFTLPAIFYLKLKESHSVPLHQFVFHVEIVLVSLSFGCCGIYSALQDFENPFKA